jgi:hypothetical protein
MVRVAKGFPRGGGGGAPNQMSTSVSRSVTRFEDRGVGDETLARDKEWAKEIGVRAPGVTPRKFNPRATHSAHFFFPPLTSTSYHQ